MLFKQTVEYCNRETRGWETILTDFFLTREGIISWLAELFWGDWSICYQLSSLPLVSKSYGNYLNQGWLSLIVFIIHDCSLKIVDEYFSGLVSGLKLFAISHIWCAFSHVWDMSAQWMDKCSVFLLRKSHNAFLDSDVNDSHLY